MDNRLWWLDEYEEITRPWITGWCLSVDINDLSAADYGPICEQIYCTVFFCEKTED